MRIDTERLDTPERMLAAVERLRRESADRAGEALRLEGHDAAAPWVDLTLFMEDMLRALRAHRRGAAEQQAMRRVFAAFRAREELDRNDAAAPAALEGGVP